MPRFDLAQPCGSMPLLLTQNMTGRPRSVIHAPLQIHALLGVVLVADHLGVNAGQIEVGRLVLAAAGDDHFGFRRFAQQGLNNRLLRQQLQIHRWIELIEDHRLVQPA